MLTPEPETLNHLPIADLLDILGRLAEDLEDPDYPQRLRPQVLWAYSEVCDEVDRRTHL